MTAVDHYTSILTLTSTSLACLGAAALTYPAEEYHARWKSKTLSTWADEQVLVPKRSAIRMVLSPFARLTFHEFTATALTSEAERRLEDHSYAMPFSKELLVGSIAGICQALILCPLDTHRAIEREAKEAELSKSWRRYWKQQFLEGGSPDSKDRLSRAYRGVGLLALREMVFNVSFFPAFSYLRHHISLQAPQAKETPYTLVSSGILAGVACSLTVAPVDAWRVHYWYSGERFSIFYGKQISAPPFSLLLRGWLVQAAIYGPTFGLVAAVYESM